MKAAKHWLFALATVGVGAAALSAGAPPTSPPATSVAAPAEVMPYSSAAPLDLAAQLTCEPSPGASAMTARRACTDTTSVARR